MKNDQKTHIARRFKDGLSMDDLAEAFGVDRSVIQAVIREAL